MTANVTTNCRTIMTEETKPCNREKKSGKNMRQNVFIQQVEKRIEKILRGCGVDRINQELNDALQQSLLADADGPECQSSSSSPTEDVAADQGKVSSSVANGARPGANGARPGANGARPGANGVRPGANGAPPDTCASSEAPDTAVAGSPSTDDLNSLLGLWCQVQGVFEDQEKEFQKLAQNNRTAPSPEPPTCGAGARGGSREQAPARRLELLRNFKNQLLTVVKDASGRLAEKDDLICQLERENEKLRGEVENRRKRVEKMDLPEDGPRSADGQMDSVLQLCKELFGALPVQGELLRSIFEILLRKTPDDEKERELKALFEAASGEPTAGEDGPGTDGNRQRTANIKSILQRIVAGLDCLKQMYDKQLDFVEEMEAASRSLVEYSGQLREEYDQLARSGAAVDEGPPGGPEDPGDDDCAPAAEETASQRCESVLRKQQQLRDKLQELGEFIRQELVSEASSC